MSNAPAIDKLVITQREYFHTEETKPLEFRRRQLRMLEAALYQHEDEILEALRADLGKSAYEAYMTELGIVHTEINYMLKHMAKLAKPKRVRVAMGQLPGRAYPRMEPYGVVLILSPWNYPLLLTLMPLAAAMAAGNTVVLKPSDYSRHTSEVLAKIMQEIFPPEYITVLQGGRAVNQSLLDQRFDYIFFTGGETVGKLVMRSAAEHLTPITLELGGKSPCIVDETADIDLAAKRIVWGKLINAGQTCVAPDYLLVHRSIRDKLLQAMPRYIEAFYGSDTLHNELYPKIISEKHFRRLTKLIDSASDTVIYGGRTDEALQKIEPTLLEPIDWASPVMQEEIFGPILPILVYDDLDELIKTLAVKPKPLALYLFTESKAVEERVLGGLSFGGGCINDTIMHLASSHLPFGGVGDSGMGSYHGTESFKTFSHKKSILKKGRFLDIPLRYPPFKQDLRWLKRLMK